MGILGNIQPRTVRIGVEIILGQDMESTILPMRRTVAQIDAVFFHYPGQKDRNRGLIKPPVPAYKRFLLVIRHQFPYPIRMCTSAYRTEMKYLVLFKSDKRVVLQKFIQIFQHLDIGIEVEAAVLFKSAQPRIIGNKGKFTLLLSLTRKFGRMNIEIIFVPQFELVVGKKKFPTLHAFTVAFGHFALSEPTIMYNFRNHSPAVLI